jgi:DNA polymerase elongation subunit (family B)
MMTRKVYKKKMRDTSTSDPSMSKAYDKIQYALKISANSMYGALSFAQYNTYSPRCGMSVTAIGRWSLNVTTCCIVAALGFSVIYGDTALPVKIAR